MAEASMIRMTHALTRRPDLSREQFQAYWRDVHAPLVRSVADLLGIRRYVQLHSLPDDPIDSTTGNTPRTPYDGVAEVWFLSREGLATRFSDPAVRAAARRVQQDEQHFIDADRSPLWWGVEHLIL